VAEASGDCESVIMFFYGMLPYRCVCWTSRWSACWKFAAIERYSVVILRGARTNFRGVLDVRGLGVTKGGTWTRVPKAARR